MSQQNQYSQRPSHGDMRAPSDLKTPVRNKYFYGKLLDVLHLEQEQRYFNDKRWLLNRLVTGPGVVCGLDVRLTDDEKGFYVTPGLAIDRCGREIIVSQQSEIQELPDFPPPRPGRKGGGYQEREETESRRGYPGRPEGHRHCEEEFAHIVLCYKECEADPVPALAANCESVQLCASGSIREQYEIKLREGKPPRSSINFPDVIRGKEINYAAIVQYITAGCRSWPEDCCIPLANILLYESDDGWEPRLDINVRPIVYTNRLLFELIVSLLKTETSEL